MAASSVTAMLSVSPGFLIQIFDFVAELEGALFALRVFKGDAALLRIQGSNSSRYLGGVHLDDGGSLAFGRKRDRAVFGYGGDAVIRLFGHNVHFLWGGYMPALS